MITDLQYILEFNLLTCSIFFLILYSSFPHHPPLPPPEVNFRFPPIPYHYLENLVLDEFKLEFT